MMTLRMEDIIVLGFDGFDGFDGFEEGEIDSGDESPQTHFLWSPAPSSPQSIPESPPAPDSNPAQSLPSLTLTLRKDQTHPVSQCSLSGSAYPPDVPSYLLSCVDWYYVEGRNPNRWHPMYAVQKTEYDHFRAALDADWDREGYRAGDTFTHNGTQYHYERVVQGDQGYTFLYESYYNTRRLVVFRAGMPQHSGHASTSNPLPGRCK